MVEPVRASFIGGSTRLGHRLNKKKAPTESGGSSVKEWAMEIKDQIGCDLCGNDEVELLQVEDRDDSVGYREELMVCESCCDERRRTR